MTNVTNYQVNMTKFVLLLRYHLGNHHGAAKWLLTNFRPCISHVTSWVWFLVMVNHATIARERRKCQYESSQPYKGWNVVAKPPNRPIFKKEDTILVCNHYHIAISSISLLSTYCSFKNHAVFFQYWLCIISFLIFK